MSQILDADAFFAESRTLEADADLLRLQEDLRNLNSDLDTGLSAFVVDAGLTESSTALTRAKLQAKIDIIYAAGGGTLRLRPIDYRIDSTPLNIRDRVRIVGSGINASVISSVSNAKIINVLTTAFNAAVVDFTIKGSVAAGTSQIGLEVEGSGQYWGFEIRNLWVKDCGGKGIYLGQNPFSIIWDNVHADNCAGYPFEFDCPIAPGLVLRNTYVHALRSTGAVGFRFKAGRFYCENLNGIDNVPTVTGSKWTVIGKKNGVDGDVVDSGANVYFNHCNLEQWDTHGALIYGSSTVSWDGFTVFDGGGNVNQIGIEYDLAGDGSTYFSQYIKRGIIADTVDFGEGAATYKNSQPIHANGFAPLQTNGQGPMQGGGAFARCNTFRNNATSKVESLARADGSFNVRTITATTTLSPSNAPEFIVLTHTAPITLTLPNALWYAKAQTPIYIDDFSAAGASVNNVTIQATGSTINGAASYLFAVDKGGLTLMPDGVSDWRIVGGHTAVPLTDDPTNGRVNNARRYAAPTTAIGAPAYSFTDQYGMGVTPIADMIMGFAVPTASGGSGVEAMRLDGSSGVVTGEVNGTWKSGPTTVVKEWTSSSPANLMADFQSYGDAIRYTFRHANGTLAVPTQTLLNDTIFNLQARSYHSGGAFATAARVAISAEAQENHTSGAQGSRIRFITTPSGSTAQAERMRITGEGLVGIISNAPSAYLDVISNLPGTPSAEFQAASGETGTASNVIFRDGSGTATVTVTANGAIKLASLADADAPNSSLYFSTTSSKPVWKDSGGVVNNLY